MRKRALLRVGLPVMISLVMCLSGALGAAAQDVQPIDIVDAVICRMVKDRKPVDPSTDFPSSVGTLFCFSRAVGAKIPTKITHVWFFGNVERARITLPVKTADWRTFSTKKIGPRETGVWHVDILDAAGNRLEVLNFNVKK